MKRAFDFAVLLLIFAASSMAQLPPAWQSWKYSAPIRPAPIANKELVSATVPQWVYARTGPGLSAVRIIDSQGQEVPYVLHVRMGKNTVEMRNSRLMDVGFAPGKDTQAILDTGTESLIHNSVHIAGADTDYFVWVEVSASDDSRSWRILHERAPIFRFTREGVTGNQQITYSPTSARYLRLRVLESTKKFGIANCRVANEVTEPPEMVAVSSLLVLDSTAPAQRSWWTLDMGAVGSPVSEARFIVEQPEFHRAVQISTSHDGKLWHAIGDGAIYRWTPLKAAGDVESKQRERLKVSFGETNARYWRVEILNRNDAPLNGVLVTLFGTPRHLVFLEDSGQSYRVVYGNPDASAPGYEMAKLTVAKTLDAAMPTEVGAEEMNTGYVDPHPLPWTEQHPFVLWSALGAAVLILGFLAVRALRPA
ncbi:MAG: DUF3999 family protein [Acidobacteria bacterium]|nr:DUF3999 family protein [Acidobacteriota bacterium]